MDLSTREGRRQQGQRIQHAIERAGLGVETLAARIGCSRALVYQYISGATLAQPDRLQRIAAATGVPLAHFYEGNDAVEGAAGGGDGTRSALSARIGELWNLADAQHNPPDWGAVISTCEHVLSLASQLGDRSAEARALLRMGVARTRTGQPGRAVADLSRAVALSPDGASTEASARQALGEALLAQGRAAEAHTQFQMVSQAGPWESRWQGFAWAAAALEERGDLAAALGQCDAAAGVLSAQARSAAVDLGLLSVDARRVSVLLASGDFLTAEPLAERCVRTSDDLGAPAPWVQARLDAGMCALHRGLWAKSHGRLSEALQGARLVGDRSREALARALLASLLAAIGDCDTCVQLAKDALALALSQANRRAELAAQAALADAYLDLERPGEARYHAALANDVAAALNLHIPGVDCRLRLARLALRAQDHGEADRHIRWSVEKAEALGARHLLAAGLVMRAALGLGQGDAPAAEADARRALDLARAAGAIPLEWRALGALARAAAAGTTPRSLEALAAAEQAVERMERVRASLREAGIADTLLEESERRDAYLLRARLLAAAGRAADAREFIEQVGWPPLAAAFGASR